MASFTLTKKSQIWSLEFIVGLLIFISALFTFYKYSINLSDIQEITQKELILDAKTIANYLMSEGMPSDWNSSNVILVGLTDGEHRLVEAKVGNFSEMDYTAAKNLFCVMNDYYVYFEDKNGSVVSVNGIIGVGKPGVTKDNLNDTEKPSDVIKIFRFAMYNSTIVRIGIYIW
jgi:hypothetical protein